MKDREKAARENEIELDEYNTAPNASDRKLSTEVSVKDDDST